MNEEEKDIIDQKEEELQNSEQELQYQAEKAKAIEAIKKFTNDEDENSFGEISFKSIIGGDILQSRFILNQVVFIMFVVILTLIYTGNRYSSQQDMLLIDSLKVELQEQKYRVLTIESELLNMSRQSVTVEKLKENGDSLLIHSTTPPFKIAIKEED